MAMYYSKSTIKSSDRGTSAICPHIKKREEKRNMKKLYRSRSNRMLCGVCGGVGEYFNIDATLVRLGMVLLSVCSLGTGLIAYFAASVIVPDEP